VQCDGIEERREVLTAPLPVEVQGDEAFDLVGTHFSEEHLEPERVEELELREIPHRQRVLLGDDETVHLGGTFLVQVKLDESAGIKVDHPRPSRCSRTMSEPLRPVFLCAVARWSGHRNTCRGMAGTIWAATLPRFSTSKVSPALTCASILAQFAFKSLTVIVFIL